MRVRVEYGFDGFGHCGRLGFAKRGRESRGSGVIGGNGSRDGGDDCPDE